MDEEGNLDIDKFKMTIDDLKKPYTKGGSYADGAQKKIILEHFYIHEIKFSFTF